MYESPINIIYGQVQTALENEVFKAVQDVNVEVDRDELIMALQYDRGQYEKGFADGRAAGAKDALEKFREELIKCLDHVGRAEPTGQTCKINENRPAGGDGDGC